MYHDEGFVINMDSSSPASLTSPPRRVRELTQSENDASSSRVPRQQTVASASRLPGSSSRSSPSPQPASARYIKQFHALMERQRQVHNDERALWIIERMELQEKVTQLENSLRRHEAISTSQVSSPVEKSGSGADSGFLSLLNPDGSRHTSTSTTGDEPWRGPKNAVQPTRTFSDDSTQSAKPDRLPSIAENPLSSRRHRQSSEHSTDRPDTHHKPSIDGAEIDKDLDGITLKASGLTLSIAPKNIMTPQSPSPAKVSPGTIELPPSTLGVPEDPYTKHAGHTPLVHGTYLNNDGASSTGSADVETPTQPEQERPPLEPQHSRVRLPSERSDSYFPTAPKETYDEDPELQGQLGLTNDDSKDRPFLDAVDSKLEQAARKKRSEPDAVAGAADQEGEGDSGDKGGEEDKEFEQPEREPQLRIKRSMNFGSAFGFKNCGKGI
ncbi:hypothetical protein OEA41_010725 [Lepraria neglecta]|uniref:Uncharacterized protein n=1 Tax=Lepraria neglecta TaxID=209136 RepID=A0AAD9YZH4_9LECA|nr:hypothetical protein OEA41_010725 [Lepraria neglecta]